MNDILSLQAQVKQLEKMVKKGKRKQKESEELQRKMIREWYTLSRYVVQNGIRVHVFKRAFSLNSKYYRSAFR